MSAGAHERRINSERRVARRRDTDFAKSSSTPDNIQPYEVVFAPADGSPIGSALAYRAWLKTRGDFVSFSDKVRALPRAERRPTVRTDLPKVDSYTC